MPAILDKMSERDRFFLEVETSGLYPGEIEDFIDQRQKVLPAATDVVGIFLVGCDGVRSEQFAFHNFGKPENGVERRAQFMAYRREEAGFGEICRLGAAGGQ